MATKIETLTRYPIKGLSGQVLDSVQLEPGKGFPRDRQFGFARPNSGFDPTDPRPLPKTKFYMLARDAALVLLSTELDDNTSVLSITGPEASDQFDISTAEGKDGASRFLKKYLALPEGESPQLFEASPHRFTDVSVVSTEMMNSVSLINLDSVRELSTAIGREVDPMRFRGNIHVSGLSPFSELEMVGRQIAIGAARLKIVKRTKRCPATEVDLNTGERNMNVPDLLQENFSHKDMGVYAEVLESGAVSPGDMVEFL